MESQIMVSNEDPVQISRSNKKLGKVLAIIRWGPTGGLTYGYTINSNKECFIRNSTQIC